jgi:integrase
VLAGAAASAPSLTAWSHAIQTQPEVGFQGHRAADLIYAELAHAGFAVTRGVAGLPARHPHPRPERPATGDSPALFPSPKGLLRDPNNTSGDLCNALDRAGFPWATSHTFRRTVADRLDDAGLSARQIADHLGHSRPSLTQDVYLGRGTASPRPRQPSSANL